MLQVNPCAQGKTHKMPTAQHAANEAARRAARQMGLNPDQVMAPLGLQLDFETLGIDNHVGASRPFLETVVKSSPESAAAMIQGARALAQVCSRATSVRIVSPLHVQAADKVLHEQVEQSIREAALATGRQRPPEETTTMRIRWLDAFPLGGDLDRDGCLVCPRQWAAYAAPEGLAVQRDDAPFRRIQGAQALIDACVHYWTANSQMYPVRGTLKGELTLQFTNPDPLQSPNAIRQALLAQGASEREIRALPGPLVDFATTFRAAPEIPEE